MRIRWLILILAGCTPPAADPFIPEYESPRLNISTDFDDDLCEGNIQLMDDYVQWMEENLDGPHEYPLWVYLYGQGETLDDCPLSELGQTSGCWADPIAYTDWPSATHELTHAYMSTINSNVLPYLREGIAEAMSGAVQVNTAQSSEWVAEHLMDPVAQPGWYQEAGYFVGWLIAEFDYGPVVEVYRRADTGLSRAEISTLFEEHFGLGLDALLSAYFAHTVRFSPGLGPFACGTGDVLPWDQGVVWSGELACSDEVVLGRYYSSSSEMESEKWRRWRVDVPVSGTYEVSIRGGGGAITSCLSEPLDDDEVPVNVDDLVQPDWSYTRPLRTPISTGEGIFDETPVELAAGTYDIWVAQKRSETQRTLSIEISPE